MSRRNKLLARKAAGGELAAALPAVTKQAEQGVTSSAGRAGQHVSGGGVSWQDLGQARSHQTYLSQCESWLTTSKDLRRLVKEYGKLVQQTSTCLQEMTKTFCSLLEATQIWQAAVAFQQAADAAQESAKKFRVQLTHDVLGTLRGFTELLPAVQESVESHKQSAAQVDRSQSRLEAVQARQMSPSAAAAAGAVSVGFTSYGGGGDAGGERRLSSGGAFVAKFQAEEEEALTGLQSASVAFANEDGKLATVWSALEETRKKLVGAALVASLNCMSWRSKHNSELFQELGKFQDVGGLEQSITRMDPVRHANGQWHAIAKSNSKLREKVRLSTNDIQCLLLCRSEDDMPDAMRENLCQRIDQLLENYLTEFNALPGTTIRVPAGFHLDPDGIEKALKNCCTELEAKAAGFCGMEMSDGDALRKQMLLDLPRSQCTIGGCLYDSAPYDEASKTFDNRLDAVREMVRRNCSLPPRDGKALRSFDDAAELRQLSVFVLSHTCHTITNGAAKTAVQLVFGKAHLVLIKPSSDHRHQRAGTIDISKQQLTVSVPSTWWIVEDAPTFGPVRPNTDLTRPLGVVNANYQITVDLTGGALEDWKQLLPTVDIQRHGATRPLTPKHGGAYPRSTLGLSEGGSSSSGGGVGGAQQQASKLLRTSFGLLKSAVRKVRHSSSGVSAPPPLAVAHGNTGAAAVSPVPSSPTSAEARHLGTAEGKNGV